MQFDLNAGEVVNHTTCPAVFWDGESLRFNVESGTIVFDMSLEEKEFLCNVLSEATPQKSTSSFRYNRYHFWYDCYQEEMEFCINCRDATFGWWIKNQHVPKIVEMLRNSPNQ